MTHQTGIRADEDLRRFMSKSKGGMVRLIKVLIVNEKLVLDQHRNCCRLWHHDFDKMVVPLIDENQPAYILYRLDTKNESGHDWLLISWTPDSAPVRQKMLYASTKSTLKQEFGQAYIKEEWHETSKDEVCLAGYHRFKNDGISPAPLTTQEEEMQRLRKTESFHVSFDCTDPLSPARRTASGVSFPVSNAVIDSVNQMVKKKLNYIQLKIDMENEEIHLVTDGVIPVDKLNDQIPKNAARYHLYSFPHEYDGNVIQSVVFIYSMPGYSCPVRERMLYSSCRAPLLDVIESNLGLTISKKLEIDADEKLTEDYLIDEIHPKQVVDKPKFEKPKGPQTRGTKRITKPVWWVRGQATE